MPKKSRNYWYRWGMPCLLFNCFKWHLLSNKGGSKRTIVPLRPAPRTLFGEALYCLTLILNWWKNGFGRQEALFPLSVESKEQLEREPQDSLLGVSEQSCLLLNCFSGIYCQKSPKNNRERSPRFSLRGVRTLESLEKSLRRRCARFHVAARELEKGGRTIWKENWRKVERDLKMSAVPRRKLSTLFDFLCV